VRPVQSTETGLLPEVNLLGEVAPAGASYSSGYQTISIPWNATAATLTFWYKPGSTASSGNFQRVLLLDPITYSPVAQLMRVLEHSATWRFASFDLTAYRGWNPVLYFEVYNSNVEYGPYTWMYLDDVSVQACTGQ
jgi:hypothetical protein